VELGLIGKYAWDDGSHRLVECLVVDGLVVGFTVELSGKREEVKFDVLVLMAFDVLKSWLELSRLESGNDSIG
jgi:hypothetical protein